MNRMTTLALPLCSLLAIAGCASTGGRPSEVDLANAQVAVRTGTNGDVIEEYRVAGQLKVVKITPLRGAPYYLMDRDGDGHLDSSKGEGPVSPVYWKLFGW